MARRRYGKCVYIKSRAQRQSVTFIYSINLPVLPSTYYSCTNNSSSLTTADAALASSSSSKSAFASSSSSKFSEKIDRSEPGKGVALSSLSELISSSSSNGTTAT